jgi:hypothetical protein
LLHIWRLVLVAAREKVSVVMIATGILGHKCGQLSEPEAIDKRFYFCSCGFGRLENSAEASFTPELSNTMVLHELYEIITCSAFV